MKSKSDKDKETDAKLLELLQKVLPKATKDTKLAGKILKAVQSELKMKNRRASFEKFCQRCELPDMEQKSIDNVRLQLVSSFKKADITLKPMKKDKCLRVEVALPDGENFHSMIRERPIEATDEEQEIALKFVPFPVSMPGDKELVWLLAKHENLTPEEAGMGLARAEESFWESKTGQNLLRKHVDRTFPEFVSRVPAGVLREVGLKRHYKTPEPVKTLQPAPKR